MDERRPAVLKDWIDWYRFARRELGLGKSEARWYANVRYVEERNREALRAKRAS